MSLLFRLIEGPGLDDAAITALPDLRLCPKCGRWELPHNTHLCHSSGKPIVALIAELIPELSIAEENES